MKILLINNHHKLVGGAHRVYFNTGELLTKKGHEVAYFSTKDKKTEPSDFIDYFVHGTNYKKASVLKKIKFSVAFLYNKKVYHAVTKLIHDFKPEVAHVHLFYGSLTVAVLKALNDNSIPIVHTVHDYRLICPVNTFLNRNNKICEKCKDQKYIHCLIDRCSKGSLFNSAILSFEGYLWKNKYKPIQLINHFIFVSKFIRNKHIEFNSQYESKSSQLYNFHQIESLQEVDKKGDYLFFYGRLSVEKGLENLLKVVSKLNVKLKIAGTGPMQGLVEEYSRQNSNIEYLCFRNGEELFSLIRNCFYVIVPSEWYENNPMTIVESFSYGKPVIGADIGGIPELVNNNENGFIFESRNMDELTNKINSAMAVTDDDYIKMSKNARTFAENNFGTKNYFNELIKVYKSVIESNEKSS